MSTRPVIGITTEPNPSVERVSVGRTYQDRILEAGGLPLLLPYGDAVPPLAEELIEHIDGLLLTGGGDLCPEAFENPPYPAESKAPVSWLMPLRDLFEQRLARLAWDKQIPVLGVCRGMQLLNVVHGGTLMRDAREIERKDPITHEHRKDVDKPFHEITIDPSSKLAHMLKTEHISVNSLHHQAIAELAPTAHACAWAPDDIVEGLEFSEHDFYLGVQWHPERMCTTPELFEGLVEAAANFALQKSEL